MNVFPLKPTHKPVKAYFETLALFLKHGHTTEGNTRAAFADLLKPCARAYGWHLVEEYAFKGTGKQPLRADGAMVDDLTLVHGLWEAKDTGDELQAEIKKKVAKGYPLTNILFQSPDRAVLYQDNRIAFDGSITTPEKLIEVLQLFCEHRQLHEVDWEEAVIKFSEKIPELARGVTTILEAEDKKNPTFHANFLSFAELCRQSINPDLSDESIRKMLVQHLLTERIFRKVFNNNEFLRRNVIAAEIEKVISSITAKHFSRDAFLKNLDHFYTAIEKAAESQEGYTEKQHFLNAVYEKFFQRFDTKQADTHGIVYTPQPIVDFMVRSVEEILQQEFGKSLSDKGVHILDPFTGTGNFITRIMQQIKRSALPHKYAEELHCNEIMLLPYYIASMNIEHAYMERAGEYAPFEGICLVDTFELAEAKQAGFAFMNEENSARVGRQRVAPITVIIGNPPYNAGQDEENDANENRSYPVLDKRVRDTYTRDSAATNRNSLSDPYIKALRWASDRLTGSGIVALVTNGKYIHGKATDGVRLHLETDFDAIYILDMGGDVRSNTKLSGPAHNVFEIQAGVAIALLVRRSPHKRSKFVSYARFDEFAKRAYKLAALDEMGVLSAVEWQKFEPDAHHRWITSSVQGEFDALMPLANTAQESGIFKSHSNGVKSNRDKWAFNFNQASLAKNIQRSLVFFNDHVERRKRQPELDINNFVMNDDSQISWSDNLKNYVDRGISSEFSEAKIRVALYRPFVKQWLYFDRHMNERVYGMESIFPFRHSNKVLIVTDHLQVPFSAQISENIPCVDIGERPSMCFPLFTYNVDGRGRTENVSSIALQRFKQRYADPNIAKIDIFHATYAILHHPEYRTRYAANLKRELPRIPFPPDLHAFAATGKRLMEIHIDYEQQPEYKLEQIEHPTNEVSFRVERMKLSKDKSELRYNDFLTLRGIPPATFDYRLGNRSALDWVIDQYRVSTDPRSGIVNDPNRADDPKYILRLIGQVISVSLETNTLIASLPPLEAANTVLNESARVVHG